MAGVLLLMSAFDATVALANGEGIGLFAGLENSCCAEHGYGVVRLIASSEIGFETGKPPAPLPIGVRGDWTLWRVLGSACEGGGAAET